MSSTTIILIVETTAVVLVGILWWQRENIYNIVNDVVSALFVYPYRNISFWRKNRKQAKQRRETRELVEILKAEGTGGNPVPFKLPDEVYQAYDLLEAIRNIPNTPTK